MVIIWFGGSNLTISWLRCLRRPSKTSHFQEFRKQECHMIPFTPTSMVKAIILEGDNGVRIGLLTFFHFQIVDFWDPFQRNWEEIRVFSTHSIILETLRVLKIWREGKGALPQIFNTILQRIKVGASFHGVLYSIICKWVMVSHS